MLKMVRVNRAPREEGESPGGRCCWDLVVAPAEPSRSGGEESALSGTESTYGCMLAAVMPSSFSSVGTIARLLSVENHRRDAIFPASCKVATVHEAEGKLTVKNVFKV